MQKTFASITINTQTKAVETSSKASKLRLSASTRRPLHSGDGTLQVTNLFLFVEIHL